MLICTHHRNIVTLFDLQVKWKTLKPLNGGIWRLHKSEHVILAWKRVDCTPFQDNGDIADGARQERERTRDVTFIRAQVNPRNRRPERSYGPNANGDEGMIMQRSNGVASNDLNRNLATWMQSLVSSKEPKESCRSSVSLILSAGMLHDSRYCVIYGNGLYMVKVAGIGAGSVRRTRIVEETARFQRHRQRPGGHRETIEAL